MIGSGPPSPLEGEGPGERADPGSTKSAFADGTQSVGWAVQSEEADFVSRLP